MTRRSAERAPVVSLRPAPTSTCARAKLKNPAMEQTSPRPRMLKSRWGLFAARSLPSTELENAFGVINKCTRGTGRTAEGGNGGQHRLPLSLPTCSVHSSVYAISSSTYAKKRRQPQHCAAEPSARFRGSSQATGSVGLPQDSNEYRERGQC